MTLEPHTEALPTPAPPRSVLYAIGRLEALVAAQAENLKDLPIRVLEVITPKLVMVEDHEKRIRALEVQRWMLSGGMLVIVTAIGWVISIKYH